MQVYPVKGVASCTTKIQEKLLKKLGAERAFPFTFDVSFTSFYFNFVMIFMFLLLLARAKKYLFLATHIRANCYSSYLCLVSPTNFSDRNRTWGINSCTTPYDIVNVIIVQYLA